MSCRVLKLVVWYHATAGVWAGKLSWQSNVGVSALLRHRAEYCSANAGNNCWGHLCHDNATYITILHHSSLLLHQSLTSAKKKQFQSFWERTTICHWVYMVWVMSLNEKGIFNFCVLSILCMFLLNAAEEDNSYNLVALGRLGLVPSIIAGKPSIL